MLLGPMKCRDNEAHRGGFRWQGDHYLCSNCDARNKGAALLVTCRECGVEAYRGNLIESAEDEMAAHGACFLCTHWLKRIEAIAKGEDRYVQINGVGYWLGPEDARGFRGFDGTAYFITRHGGARQRTTNLWCQGEIPQRFRDRLPDNAELEHS
jgi:ribosomal protein L40E